MNIRSLPAISLCPSFSQPLCGNSVDVRQEEETLIKFAFRSVKIVVHDEINMRVNKKQATTCIGNIIFLTNATRNRGYKLPQKDSDLDSFVFSFRFFTAQNLAHES